MKTFAALTNLVVSTNKLVRRYNTSDSMPFKRVAMLSAAMTFAALNGMGCIAGEPDAESESMAGLESEAVQNAEQDLTKGCASGTTFCANEFDPDIGQYSICCNTTTEVCQNLECVPKSTRPLEHGTALPKFKVLGLVYSPPGKESEVRYSSSSSFGTHTDVSNSFKSGVAVSFSSSVLDINSQFTAGAFLGSEFEQKKTTTYAYSQAASPARIDDELRSEEDSFFVWLNPKIEVNEVAPLSYNFQLGTENNAAPDTVWISVREINNPALIPAWKASKLSAAGVNNTDLQNIKKLDPVAMGSNISTLGRYKLVAQLPLLGPSYEGGDIPGNYFGIDNEQVKSTVAGVSASISVEVLVGFELSFFGTAGLKAGSVFEWEHESKSAIVNGESQGAEVKLSTDTVGHFSTYDIYYDSIFRVFAYKKVSALAGAPVLSGLVADTSGNALVGERVLIRLADGRTVYTVTDKEGRYQMLNLPEGLAEVAVGQASAKVDIRANERPELRLELPSH